MRQWLIESNDGVPRGPATTTDIARAVHAGILGRQQRIAPTTSPKNWQAIASIREVERAIAELSIPENDEPDEALRTLIASPAELASLEAEPPDSMDAIRRLAPNPRVGQPPPVREQEEEESPDSEPRTLIAPSPFETVPEPDHDSHHPVSVKTEPDPVYVVMPKVAPARPAAGRAVAPAVDPGRRAVEEAPTLVATPDPRIRHVPITSAGQVAPSANAGTNPGMRVANSRGRLFLALAFAGGLIGGLAMLFIVYALVER